MMRLTQVLGSDSFERSVSPRIVELVPDDDHAVAVLTAPDGSFLLTSTRTTLGRPKAAATRSFARTAGQA